MRPGKRLVTMVVAVALGAVVLAACSSNSTTSDTDTGATDTSSSMADQDMATSEPFGAGCAAVPEEGAGSFDGMASDPVATAASNNPALSTLVTAVGEANLGDTLNSAEDITVFAPSNDAFDAVPKKMMKNVMGDPEGMLTDVLTYHVVPGQLTPEDLAGEHETLNGATLTVSGSGEDFTVNDTAAVVCGNIHTANATVYIIDGVLVPPAA